MSGILFEEISSDLASKVKTPCSIWVRSHNIVFIDVDEIGGALVYNRFLNHPYWIDAEGKEFILSHDTLNTQNLECDENFLRELINNYTYFPINGYCEADLIKRGIDNHLQNLSEGRYTMLLDLRISTACNFGCPHCIAEAAKTNNFMTLEQACSIVDAYVSFIANSGNRHIDIHFGIAEPFLAFDVLQGVVKYVSSKYSDYTYEYSVNTNLSILSDENIKFLKQNDVHLHVSIDGLQQANDLIRVFKDGSGTYSVVANNIDRLETAGYPISDIGVTLTDKNYYHFKQTVDEFIDWCCARKITEVACEFDLVNTSSISTGEKVSFLTALIDKMASKGISFDGTWSIPYRNLLNASYDVEAYSFCRGASGINLSVDSNMDVFLCSCSSVPICSMAEISEAIRPQGKFYEFVLNNLLLSQTGCQECVIAGCCVGQCKVTKEYHSKNDKMIVGQCEFYKQITHALLARDAIQTVLGG